MSSEQKNWSSFILDQSQMRVKSDWELKELWLFCSVLVLRWVAPVEFVTLQNLTTLPVHLGQTTIGCTASCWSLFMLATGLLQDKFSIYCCVMSLYGSQKTFYKLNKNVASQKQVLYHNPTPLLHQKKSPLNRPLALRGHVTSFLWKWKIHDFALETVLVGHLLNKIKVIWFFKPAPIA